jgi:hypothetical protein
MRSYCGNPQVLFYDSNLNFWFVKARQGSNPVHLTARLSGIQRTVNRRPFLFGFIAWALRWGYTLKKSQPGPFRGTRRPRCSAHKHRQTYHQGCHFPAPFSPVRQAPRHDYQLRFLSSRLQNRGQYDYCGNHVDT